MDKETRALYRPTPVPWKTITIKMDDVEVILKKTTNGDELINHSIFGLDPERQTYIAEEEAVIIDLVGTGTRSERLIEQQRNKSVSVKFGEMDNFVSFGPKKDGSCEVWTFFMDPMTTTLEEDQEELARMERESELNPQEDAPVKIDPALRERVMGILEKYKDYKGVTE